MPGLRLWLDEDAGSEVTGASCTSSLDAVVLRRVRLIGVDADTDLPTPSLRRNILLIVIVKVGALDRIWVLLRVHLTRLLLKRSHRRLSIGIRSVRQRRAQVVRGRLRTEAAGSRLVQDLLL